MEQTQCRLVHPHAPTKTRPPGHLILLPDSGFSNPWRKPVCLAAVSLTQILPAAVGGVGKAADSLCYGPLYSVHLVPFKHPRSTGEEPGVTQRGRGRGGTQAGPSDPEAPTLPPLSPQSPGSASSPEGWPQGSGRGTGKPVAHPTGPAA